MTFARTRVLAEALLRAEATGALVDPGAGGDDVTMDEAYEVGARIARTRLLRGWRFAGWKVGFTNREIWPRWGLDRPMVAPVYRETVFMVEERDRGMSGSAPVRVPAGRRAALRIEVEVVFGFEAAVASGERPGNGAEPGRGRESIQRTNWVALGAELVDCHYPGWELHPARSVADFGLHAGLVVGPRIAPVPPTLLRALDGVAVTLWSGGERLAQGAGSAVLGGPANVLAEMSGPLAERVAGYGAADAGGGYLVSTGTLTPLVEARIGTRYEVAADLLPSFSFALA